MTRRNHRLRNILTPRGAGTVAAAFVLCAYAASPPGSPSRAVLVWNTTASAPLGLYRVDRARKFERGNFVLAVPAPTLAAFAARRGYLPQGVPLVKRIAAVTGDTVCALGDTIVIDGRFTAARLAADGKGRPLPSWTGCRTLRPGETFLMTANVRASFDGRYFGPTPTSQIMGTLYPLWTR